VEEKKIYYIGAGVLGLLCLIYGIYKYDMMHLSQMSKEAYHKDVQSFVSERKNTSSRDSKMQPEIKQYGALLEKIQEIKVKKALLQQEIDLRQVENELHTVRKEVELLSEDPMMENVSMDKNQDIYYKFVMIKKHKGDWYATFSRDGKVYKVKSGDTLPGGYRVQNISEKSTILKKGTEEFIRVF